MLKHYLELPRQVYVLCVGTFINRAGTFLLPFLSLYLVNDLKLGSEFAGLAMSVFGLGALSGALCGGHLADRFGRRVVMLTALLSGAAILCVFGYLRSPWAILAALGLFSFLSDMYRPAANAMVADLLPPEHRPYAFGLMYVAINLGFTVGPAAGGWIQARHSFLVLFWADAITAGIYALIIMAMVRETRPGHAATTAPDGRAGSSPGADSAEGGGLSALRHILSDRTFVVFCLATLLVGLGYMQCMSSFPLFLDRDRGMGGDAYGRIIAVNGLMIVLCQIPLTQFLRRFNRASVVALSAVFAAAGFGSTALARTEGQFMLTVMIWTAGEMMSAAFSPSIVSDLAPARLRARYMGAFSMCFSSAVMLGAPVGMVVLDRWGGRTLWVSSLGLGLGSALLYLSVHGRIGTPKRHTGAGPSHTPGS